MPWFDIFWTPEAEEHLAAHGVTIQEFEEVLLAASRRMIETSASSDYFTIAGETSTGRPLRIVFDMLDDLTVLPITAYEPSEE